MNEHILHKAVQDFLVDYGLKDPLPLAFKKAVFLNVTNKELIEQLVSRKKASKKLPSWYAENTIYYPPPISIEQASSERTAKYKANLIKGESIIDITGGFGVDCFYFSKKVTRVTHCEQQLQLSEIAGHNFKQLGVNNISCIAQDGIQFLQDTNLHFDWIYVDPGRRDTTKRKVFFLSDCTPNVPKHIELLLKKTDNVLIKTSPLLDISVGLKELVHVKEIHIVALKNEVKELLWVIGKKEANDIAVTAINLDTEQESFKTTYPLKNAEVQYSIPENYLYEPNPAILKSGAFNEVASQYQLKKLHQHSHLYTSVDQINFPGRIFKVQKVFDYSKKKLKSIFKGTKANISCRNFPESPIALKKILNIKDGGSKYLFFTTISNGDLAVLECIKS
ncbi:class I SAM-dependent methyltransferase [Spongiivirga sp. MCCC 1A20706]|uniref:THUMP-like domain-containing protein n=1 Tax=Spongiivirga sp. MCCC 1A20706 TaxID=3160963 RepID=UPI003977933C